MFKYIEHFLAALFPVVWSNAAGEAEDPDPGHGGAAQPAGGAGHAGGEASEQAAEHRAGARAEAAEHRDAVFEKPFPVATAGHQPHADRNEDADPEMPGKTGEISL